MIDQPLHIVFAGGGTAGHLFPGLAVATRLAGRVPALRVTFAGSGKEFERRHVRAAGFDYRTLPCRPYPKGLRQVPSFCTRNLQGYLAARRFLRQRSVAAVVGLGGYASVPMAKAASRAGVPLVLLEQNAIAGRATRWLARSATLICTAMAEARAELRCTCPVYVTGNPLRSGKVLSARPIERPARREKRLLVLGGSNGARALNENVPPALAAIRSKLSGWQIVHQSGDANLEATRQAYDQLDMQVSVVPFVDDLARLLVGADLVICRAGGTTLAELAAAGVPAILVPYPYAADDHQRRNAEAFAAAGGAIVLEQGGLDVRLRLQLARLIADLIGAPARRLEMAASMRRS